ncbi:hypothetical protein [Salana multivorans]
MTAPAVTYTDNPAQDVLRARSRLANLHQGKRFGVLPDPDEVAQAKRELNELVLARHIRELVDAAPPLTAEQRDRLATLLRGGAR